MSALTDAREAAIIERGWANDWGIPEWRCGHPRSPENTKLVRNNTGTACRICHRRLNREYNAKRRA